MRISHKHKFLFIEVTKTGSTSIRGALSQFSDIPATTEKDSPHPLNILNHTSPFRIHAPAWELKNQFKESEWNWSEYFKFAFVRNPWDRLVSMHNYKLRRTQTWNDFMSEFQGHMINMNMDIQELQSRAFSQPVEEKNNDHCMKIDVPDFRKFASDPDTPQTKWLVSGDDLIVDFIGRFENLQQDFNTVCDRIGIPHQELPHANKTNHRHYTEYYDDETKQIVAERYAKDIEYFGYKFGK